MAQDYSVAKMGNLPSYDDYGFDTMHFERILASDEYNAWIVDRYRELYQWQANGAGGVGEWLSIGAPSANEEVKQFAIANTRILALNTKGWLYEYRENEWTKQWTKRNGFSQFMTALGDDVYGLVDGDVYQILLSDMEDKPLPDFSVLHGRVARFLQGNALTLYHEYDRSSLPSDFVYEIYERPYPGGEAVRVPTVIPPVISSAEGMPGVNTDTVLTIFVGAWINGDPREYYLVARNKNTGEKMYTTKPVVCDLPTLPDLLPETLEC